MTTILSAATIVASAFVVAAALISMSVVFQRQRLAKAQSFGVSWRSVRFSVHELRGFEALRETPEWKATTRRHALAAILMFTGGLIIASAAYFQFGV